MKRTKLSGGQKAALLLPGCFLLGVAVWASASAVGRARAEHLRQRAETAEPELREEVLWFNHLTAKEQMLYDAAKEAVTHFRKQSAAVPFVPTAEEARHALDALFLDCPALCDPDAESPVLLTSDSGGAFRFAFEDRPKERRAELHRAADALLAGLPDGGSYAQALWLHDALAAAVTSGEGAGSTAYDALVRGKADGFGYASAYRLLCEEAGIPCEIVTGTADGTVHAWNCVQTDGETGYTDVLWDDSDAADLPLHGYFQLPLSEMSLDHMPADPALWEEGAPPSYYESIGAAAAEEDALPALLAEILGAARKEQREYAELSLPAGTDSSVLAAAFAEAAKAVSAEESTAPCLRPETRIYPVSASGRAVTIRLFYTACPQKDAAEDAQTASAPENDTEEP